ncbi:hypothetical protein Aph02nite_17430 [Actinoplanes philippinensis]|nr:hypothetical protein Aph02nite_17430 [Actinoplanes philippinensis]
MTAPDGLPWHAADTATWDCRTCGYPWPCETARTSLWETADRRSDLLLRLASDLEEAALVLDEPDLYQRFVGWARRPGRKQEGDTHGDPVQGHDGQPAGAGRRHLDEEHQVDPQQ